MNNKIQLQFSLQQQLQNWVSVPSQPFTKDGYTNNKQVRKEYKKQKKLEQINYYNKELKRLKQCKNVKEFNELRAIISIKYEKKYPGEKSPFRSMSFGALPQSQEYKSDNESSEDSYEEEEMYEEMERRNATQRNAQNDLSSKQKSQELNENKKRSNPASHNDKGGMQTVRKVVIKIDEKNSTKPVPVIHSQKDQDSQGYNARKQKRRKERVEYLKFIKDELIKCGNKANFDIYKKYFIKQYKKRFDGRLADFMSWRFEYLKKNSDQRHGAYSDEENKHSASLSPSERYDACSDKKSINTETLTPSEIEDTDSKHRNDENENKESQDSSSPKWGPKDAQMKKSDNANTTKAFKDEFSSVDYEDYDTRELEQQLHEDLNEENSEKTGKKDQSLQYTEQDIVQINTEELKKIPSMNFNGGEDNNFVQGCQKDQSLEDLKLYYEMNTEELYYNMLMYSGKESQKNPQDSPSPKWGPKEARNGSNKDGSRE